MAKKSAKGSGTIRKKTVIRSGKEYTYWEARVTIGRDPGTGKQVQRSFSGKTQKEVREKMQAVAVEVNEGTYTAPVKMTVGEWLSIWERDYLGRVKPSTANRYQNAIRLHIRPALGAVRLSDLHPHTVQNFINQLNRAPATVRLIFDVLKQALKQAVELDYIPRNPAEKCIPPKMKQREIVPLTDEQVSTLFQTVKGGELDYFIRVALFTGMRLSELLGLTWDAIDMQQGTILINKQLAPPVQWDSAGLFTTPKSNKSRTITVASSVLQILWAQRLRQSEMQTKAGNLWENNFQLVFTDEIGGPWNPGKIERQFRSVIKTAGLKSVRFHDLRHTYAVNSIRAGDDIKTIQSNLGHSTAAFTLDRYGHFTESMQKASADRMENFIKAVLNL